MHVDRDRTNQTHISRGSSRRAVFLRMLPPGLAVLFLTSGLFGWASVSTTGIFATHQFFSRIAYQRLSEHPVFRHIRFPSLEAIEKYSGVHVESFDPFVIGGEGPDNSRICRYSDHWYNPLNETGGASLAVQKHYDLLRMKLANRGLSFGRHEIDPDRKWPQAKDAAWMAHFAQDMTCPLHVLGMPREKADEDFPQGENITGPYRTFDPALWRSSLRAARNDPHGALADWFDPNYYDGSSPGVTFRSTHFVYEATVEYKYVQAQAVLMPGVTGAVNPDFISREWRPPMTIERFAHEVAATTRRRMRAREPELMFDGDDLQTSALRMTAAALNLTDQFPDLSKRIKVPIREWARAIEATYTLWRASFSALAVRNIRLAKVPGQPDMFRLQMEVLNYEPEESALDLEAGFEIQGGKIPSRGGFRFLGGKSTVPAHSSAGPGVVEAESRTRFKLSSGFLEKPENLAGRLQIRVKGRYLNIPDSGRMVREFRLRDVPHNLKPMPGVIGDDRETARRALMRLFEDDPPPELQILAERDPPEPGDAGKVYRQNPAPGTLIGPGHAVTLKIYREFAGTIRVPSVIGATVEEARDRIERRLAPPDNRLMLKAVMSAGARPRDLVIDQEPEAGRLVPLGSDVLIFFKRGEREDPGTRITPEGGAKPRRKRPEGGEVTEEDAPPALQVGSIAIDPPAAVLDPEEEPLVVLFATFFDLEGNNITDRVLETYDITWMASDPSLALVEGVADTAIVTPAGTRTGTVQVICSIPVNMAAVQVTIRGGSGRDEPGGRTPPPERESKACQNLKSQFYGALKRGELDWAQTILSSSRTCLFSAAAARALEQARTRQEPERPGCLYLDLAFGQALIDGNYDECRRILELGKDCPFAPKAAARLEKMVKGEENLDYNRRMLDALKSNNPALAQALLREAQARGHRFPEYVPRLIRQAVAARTSAERNRVLRTLLDSMATVIGGIEQRQPPPPARRPPGDPGDRPVPSSAPISFFGYVQEDLKVHAKRSAAEIGRRYGEVFSIDLTHDDLRMQLHPRAGGGRIVFSAPVRFPITLWVRNQGRQIPPIRATWYLDFKRSELNPDGSARGRLAMVFTWRVPGSEAEFRQDEQGSWRMAPAGPDAFWLYIISESGFELPRAFLLRRLN